MLLTQALKKNTYLEAKTIMLKYCITQPGNELLLRSSVDLKSLSSISSMSLTSVLTHFTEVVMMLITVTLDDFSISRTDQPICLS